MNDSVGVTFHGIKTRKSLLTTKTRLCFCLYLSSLFLVLDKKCFTDVRKGCKGLRSLSDDDVTNPWNERLFCSSGDKTAVC